VCIRPSLRSLCLGGSISLHLCGLWLVDDVLDDGSRAEPPREVVQAIEPKLTFVQVDFVEPDSSGGSAADTRAETQPLRLPAASSAPRSAPRSNPKVTVPRSRPTQPTSDAAAPVEAAPTVSDAPIAEGSASPTAPGEAVATTGPGPSGVGRGPGGGTASGDGSGTGGGTGRGIATDDDPVKVWLGTVRARIKAAKRYPQMARRLRLEGTVVLSFRIAPGGQLLEVRAHDDAPELLREAAVDAVRRAAPFPPAPRGDRAVGLEVPLVFSLTHD